MDYKLKTPIVLGVETVEVLTLDEPTVDALEKFDVDLSEDALSKVGGMKRLVCACCTNTTEAHIGRMKLRDLVGAVEVCSSFFG